MKKVTFILAILMATTWAKAQQWKELQTGVDQAFQDICCVDTINVLICGQNGLIIQTKNGGQSWEQKNSNTESDLYLIKFANDSIGFTCGDDIFLKTTDGGENWINMETNPEIGFNYSSYLSRTNLFLVDADTIYLTDSHNNLWKSTDGGENFEKALDLQDTMEDFYKFDLYFEDNVGYLVGYDSDWLFPLGLTAFKTLDYGKTWETIEFNECESRLSAVHFVDKDHVRLFGYFATSPDEYYGILETSDGLGSYSLLQPIELWAGLPVPWNLGRYITFLSENTGCFIYNYDNYATINEQSDFSSYVFLTQDNGESWTSALEGINQRNYLFAVDGVNMVLYIAASHGCVYKACPVDVYGFNKNENVLKVFPNPTTDKIIITIASDFDIENSELCSVELSNVSGQVVMRNTICSSSTILDTSHLPNGIYIMTLRNGRQRFVKKIVKQ